MTKKLWLWKNGPNEFWAFDNLYPCHPNGDPMTLGDPCGYALVMESVDARKLDNITPTVSGGTNWAQGNRPR